MTTTTTPPRVDRQSAAKARFAADTRDHTIRVIRDDGDVYRHLRFGRPGTGVYSFDLVTWPGYLAFVGDMGDYLFSRTRDMFQFFGDRDGRAIDPHYWAQKVQGSGDVTAYSVDRFHEIVNDWLADQTDRYRFLEKDVADALRDAVHELLSQSPSTAEEARDLLDTFDHAGHRFHDTWEYRWEDFTGRFLWACHAIQWGISTYRIVTRHADVPA